MEEKTSRGMVDWWKDQREKRGLPAPKTYSTPPYIPTGHDPMNPILKTYDEVLAALEKQLSEHPDPDSPMLGMGTRTMTFRQIVQSIRDKTEEGMQRVERWIKLSEIAEKSKIELEQQEPERWDDMS